MLSFLKKYSPSQIGSGKNIRLFKNSFFEQMSYVHPIIPLLLWVPISTFFFLYEQRTGELTLFQSALLAGIGLAVWTLSEYLLHRYIFHYKPKTEFGKKVAFLLHGIHHADPEDARRLLMPPFAALVIAGILYGFFFLFIGGVAIKPFFAGFLVGYLFYDYIHFTVHFIQPKSQVMKKLKQNHMLHHYSTPDLRYGVSNTLWDHVFGSRPEYTSKYTRSKSTK